MTEPHPDKASWSTVGKAAGEARPKPKRQRVKATASPMPPSWDEDAETAVTPVDAIIPAAAFRDAEAPIQLDASEQAAPRVSRATSSTVPPATKARSRPRPWLFLSVATLLSFVVAYTGFSVAHKLEQRAARLPPGAESASVRGALGEVIGDVQAKVEGLVARARGQAQRLRPEPGPR